MSNAISPVARIAQAYGVLSRSDAGARWRWATQILKLRDAQPEKKRGAMDKELGAECANAVGRDKPYSPQWVRAYVNAARQFQTAPTTPQEAEQFLALCNNAQTAKSDKSASAADDQSDDQSNTKSKMTKEDALRMLASAVKLARKRGASDVEIAQAMSGTIHAKSGAAA